MTRARPSAPLAPGPAGWMGMSPPGPWLRLGGGREEAEDA
jgi:hypothetical protein